MWIDALYHLAIQFKHKTQNAMSGRMLRTEVDVESCGRCVQSWLFHRFQIARHT